MLDTLLEIGQRLRESPNGLRHHRYIKKAPPDDDKFPINFWRVPVAEDYSFDFSQIGWLKDEKRKAQLFYLNFKNGEADSTKPYVFGDIFRFYVAKEKKKRDGKTEVETSETGNFLFGDPEKGSWMGQNSFLRYKDGHIEAAIEGAGKKVKAVVPANALLSEGILKFRASFRQQLPHILEFLENNPRSYVHFDFGGKGWWELPDKDAIEKILLENFIVSSREGFVFQAFIYKTIMSGGTGTPNFFTSNDYKVRLFRSSDEVLDLLYALNFAKRAAVRERDIKIIVLPRGENLTAQQIERFFEKSGLGAEETKEDAIENEEQAEAKAKAKEKKPESPENGFDPTFGMLPVDAKSEANLLQFDFIFSRDGGTKPDVDLVEIAGIERSKLYDVAKRVRKVKEATEAERDAFFDAIINRATKTKSPIAPDEEAKKLAKTKRPPIFLTRAFLNLLGDQTTAKKKYQSHLLKVLPQIYTATYFHDPVLLPAFIEKIESNIRNDDGLGFNLLKWDFRFLSRIQNHDGDRLMDIQNSPSYQVGVLLGQLARGLRSKINSFDKNYAGLLSRRIPNLLDVVSLHVEIDQKLIMHGKANLAFKVSPLLTDALKNFDEQEEKYNKDMCAFGFFESYFAPYKSAEEAAKEEELPPLVVVEGASDDSPVTSEAVAV